MGLRQGDSLFLKVLALDSGQISGVRNGLCQGVSSIFIHCIYPRALMADYLERFAFQSFIKIFVIGID